MRVITGTARGRRLRTLEGDDVRPTTDRVKEAIFSIIQFEIEGRRVLDLFAGSGQLGIEALSRGAAYALFVDQSREAVKVVKENLSATGLNQNAAVLHTDAFSALGAAGEAFDLIFLDPPYGSGLLLRVLPEAAMHLARGGVMICEAPRGEELPEQAGAAVLYRRYRYGKIEVAVYRREEAV